MRHPGSDYPIVARKWSNAQGAKGVGCGAEFTEPTRKGRSPGNQAGRLLGVVIPNSSRMNREIAVRFLEGLRVKFPGPTRLSKGLP